MFDTYRAKRKAEKDRIDAENDVKPEKDTISLTKILSDKKLSTLFGKMLEREGAHDLATNIMDGTPLKDGDLGLLEGHREAFQEIMDKVDEVNESLTPENIENMAANSRSFEKIINLVSPEKGSTLLKAEMADLAISKPAEFEMILLQVKMIAEYKENDMKDLEKEIKEYCETNDVKSVEVEKALALEDEDKRREAVQKLVKASYGDFSKAVNFMSAGTLTRMMTGNLLKRKDQIDNAYSELDRLTGNVGKALSVSISGSQELKDAVSRSFLQEAPEKPQSDFKEVRESKGLMPKVGDTEAAWKTAKAKIRNWGTLSDAEKDAKVNEFIDSHVEESSRKIKGGGGFWASIFKSLLHSKISSGKAQNMFV